jgi:transposase-like protein
MTRTLLFKWRHFAPEIIVCGVQWYLRYALSYRDVAELMLERGLHVDHTAVFRWVQRYAPEAMGVLKQRGGTRPSCCETPRESRAGVWLIPYHPMHPPRL